MSDPVDVRSRAGRTNRFATISLVLAIVGFLVGAVAGVGIVVRMVYCAFGCEVSPLDTLWVSMVGIAGLVFLAAIILAIVARRRIRRSGGVERGQARALGALVLATIGLLSAWGPFVSRLVRSPSPACDAPALFGEAVALDGNTALIGAWGAAYVFADSGGSWTQRARITPADAKDDSGFYSVAVSGTTALIGAGHGAAYVFTELSGTWGQRAKLTASDGSRGDGFGSPVALDGPTALIGAHNSAYVFAEKDGTWTQRAKLIPADGASGQRFGESVTISDGTIFIGAPGDGLLESVPGAVYVFTEANGIWAQSAKLVPSAPIGAFGASVAISGSTGLVVVPGTDTVRAFTDMGTGWTQQGELTAVGLPASHYSVALSGTTALVGGQDDIDRSIEVVHVFTEANGTWTQSAELMAAESAGSVQSVAISGHVALIGGVGAGHIFEWTGGAWTQSAVVRPPYCLEA